MLKKENRLLADRDFKRLFRQGRRFAGPGLNLIAVKSGRPKTRCGFVVGTKVDKRAVVRNRLKRIMRETVREVWPGIRPGFDIALIANRKILEIKDSGLPKAVRHLMKISGILEKTDV